MDQKTKKAAVKALKDAAKRRDDAYTEARETSHDLWELVNNSPLNVSEIARAVGVSRGAVYSWKRQNSRRN